MTSLDHADGGYQQGWQDGLSAGALALALAAFINLLSIEKSLLAAVLAVIAMRGGQSGKATRRARLALGISAVHLTIAVIALILLRNKFGQLLHLLQTLG